VTTKKTKKKLRNNPEMMYSEIDKYMTKTYQHMQMAMSGRTKKDNLTDGTINKEKIHQLSTFVENQ
jgi:hypothetical protein